MAPRHETETFLGRGWASFYLGYHRLLNLCYHGDAVDCQFTLVHWFYGNKGYPKVQHFH